MWERSGNPSLQNTMRSSTNPFPKQMVALIQSKGAHTDYLLICNWFISVFMLMNIFLKQGGRFFFPRYYAHMLIFFLFFCFFVLSIMFIFCKTINLTTNFRKRPHIVWKLPAKFLSHIFRSVCPSITFSVSALPPLPIPRDYRAVYPALFCDQFRSAHY